MEIIKKYRKWKKEWDDLNRGWKGTAIYSVLGIIFALFIQLGLGYINSTSLPVVTVSSESMVPALNVGDIVFIQGKATYAPGDIIVFRGWREDPIIHRIVAKIEGGEIERLAGFSAPDERLSRLAVPARTVYITKGDHNPSYDQDYGNPPIAQQSVFGSGFFVIPYLGWVKILFVRVFGNNIALGIAMVFSILLMYSYIVDLLKKK